MAGPNPRDGAQRGADDIADPHGFEQLMVDARPSTGDGRSLEKRLAIASIVASKSTKLARPRLGRLEVQSRIGGGAMGVIYRAYDPQLDRLVAVKLVRSWTGTDDRLRIVDEARRLARLNHPHVVAVHDIVNDDADGLYFTMEYVAGRSLGGWLQDHPDAGWRNVLEWFVQAGRGLEAAHAVGMVHRDFKPDNVLVGSDGRVRVADFGLAHLLSDPDAQELAGTPYYMAPEVRALCPASAASDQFSYCLALRDALAGRALPAHVGSAIERGLDADPERRHADLRSLVDILAGALAHGKDQGARALLFDRVERLWLRGVLERALGDGNAAELTLLGAADLVEPPWQSWGTSPAATLPSPTVGEFERTTSRQLGQLLVEAQGALLIVGPPGAGKTTLLLLLCRELWRSASLNPETPAPVVLSLSTYRPPEVPNSDAGGHLRAWIVDELVTKYGLPRPSVQRWLEEGQLALLLDGLDETDPHVRGGVVAALNAFRKQRALQVVVTCRDSEYDALGRRLAFGAAVRVQPLEDAQMAMLLEERRANGLLEALTQDVASREALRNPLLLTLYASGEPPEIAGGSDGWSRAYEHYVQAAWARAEPGERAVLEPQLGWLAAAMRRMSTSDLWLERLHFGWLDAGWERRAGYLCGALLVGLFALGANVWQVPVTGYPLASALVFGGGVWLSSFAYTRGRITPVESLRWSGRRALRLAPITTVLALSIGLIEALKINFASNMVGAGLTGSILGLIFALEPGERAVRVRANAGIHQSFANAMRLSLGAGLAVGLAFYMVIQPLILHPLATEPEYGSAGQLIVGVAVGLFVFTAVFLIYGGYTTIMHYAMRLWLAWRTPLPLNLAAALERASELGLMRRVGGGYVFLHRSLLDHFADRSGR